MTVPELFRPDAAAVGHIVRECRLPLEAASVIAGTLAALVDELRAEVGLSAADRQRHRRERLDALRRAAKALRSVVDAVETARPAGAAALRDVLGSAAGQMLSSAAFGQLLDFPISITLSGRERQSRAANLRGGGGVVTLLESKAELQRQVLAERHGDRLLAGFAHTLAKRVEAELALERLNKGGPPLDRPRRIVLVRLFQLQERLNSCPLPSQVSQDFIAFCERCCEAIGFSTEGIEPAVNRLFRQLRNAGEPTS